MGPTWYCNSSAHPLSFQPATHGPEHTKGDASLETLRNNLHPVIQTSASPLPFTSFPFLSPQNTHHTALGKAHKYAESSGSQKQTIFFSRQIFFSSPAEPHASSFSVGGPRAKKVTIISSFFMWRLKEGAYRSFGSSYARCRMHIFIPILPWVFDEAPE